MWEEIKGKAKLELLHSLFMVKIVAADESSTPSSLDEVTPETFYSKKSLSNAVLNQWKTILSICEENQLFWCKWIIEN